ncbi:MAG: phosphoribosylformylglycinamidine cyclo-ligase [Oligoflexia bacterium]|nr:phosphoribosylformylglycinamidine cyclo-ligase [Oligoflexia bacterium]
MPKRSSAHERKDASTYSALGASASKAGVHAAVGYKAGSSYFAEPLPDVCGNADYYSFLHSDGAGTKSIIGYLAYRESKDTSWFRNLAFDSLSMNLDDVACVGALTSLTLTNTIGRNRQLIPDQAIQEIVSGYRDAAKRMASYGIDISLAGGETADLGDIVRTLVVDSALFARVKRKHAVCFDRVCEGDVIIGLASFGKCAYESEFNSGIGSNGLTLARHALIHSSYAEKYPEILDPTIDASLAYRGKHKLFDAPKPLSQNIARALLSPTRSYAPFIAAALQELGTEVHGLVHCTGSGQTKIKNFGRGKRYIKNGFFPTPAIFEAIQASLNIPWEEMYSVFNMGHRLEVICPEKSAKVIEKLAARLKIDTIKVGFVEEIRGSRNEVVLDTPYGCFER